MLRGWQHARCHGECFSYAAEFRNVTPKLYQATVPGGGSQLPTNSRQQRPWPWSTGFKAHGHGSTRLGVCRVIGEYCVRAFYSLEVWHDNACCHTIGMLGFGRHAETKGRNLQLGRFLGSASTVQLTPRCVSAPAQHTGIDVSQH